ncbi:MAG: aminotransferase IV, partial [bacterium]|nr:aminotransferase IV [bacterium]
CEERDLSLTEFYSADEVFTSGTMGEMTPVYEIDGRKVEASTDLRLLPMIREKFHSKIPELAEKL